MTADPGIYNLLGRGVKSFQDYQAEDDDAQTRKLNLLSAKSQYGQGQQDIADRNALRSVAQTFTPDTSDNYRKILSTGNVKAAADYQKSVLDAGKTTAETGLSQSHAKYFDSETTGKQLDQSIKAHDFHVQELGSVTDPSQIPGWVADGVKSGVFTQEQGQAGLARAQQMIGQPGGFDAWKQSALQGGSSATEQLKLQQAKQLGDQTAAVSRLNNSDTNRARLAGIGITQAGENGRQATRLAQESAVGGAEGFSPAAIENAASRYNLDGTLPPMGMGKAGSQGRQAILNRAAELSVGTSGTDQRISQMDAKSSAGALTQLTKAKTMNASFEKTANANADLALGLSDKLDRTGIPLLNAGIQAYRTGTGSPEATQFAAANQTFVSEYAKIMSGGMGNGPVSDAARGKAEKLLTTSMTAGQYKGNVKLLQTEMANRMKGFEDEEGALRSRLKGSTPAPQSAAAATGVPDDIAVILKKHGAKNGNP